MARLDRRVTYPGLGATDAYDSDTDRVVRTTIIPRRVGGIIKSPGFQLFPLNVQQRLMGSRRWKFAAGRMTHGGTSSFFDSKYTGVNAQIVRAWTEAPFVNNINVTFNQEVAAGIKSTWDVFVNGTSVNVGGVQFATEGDKFTLTIGGLPNILAGQVLEVSHVLPGQGIPIITKFPVENLHV